MKAATFADLVVMAQQLRDVARAPAAPRLASGTASSAARIELAAAL